MAVPPTIEIASIGIQDSLFLMLLALVVFGPRRLPEIGRQIGKLMYEFRKVSNEFKYQMEEELRASEEAERQRKLQAELSNPSATSQATLGVPPQPAAETGPAPDAVSIDSPVAGLPFAAEGAAASEAVPAVTGEVRGEPRRFPPAFQPPVSGEVVAAQRPFRGFVPETAESVTESGSEAHPAVETPVAVQDEGRIGSEVQPGVESDLLSRAASGSEASHV
jgi:sec-independent protein translocase protein TatB